MSNTSRVKINIHEGMIELEGSEGFVSRYLNEFKDLIVHKAETRSKKEEGVVKTADKKERIEEKPQQKKSAKPPKVEVEAFEVKAVKDKPSLKDFFESKNPPRDKGPARIAVIAYHITHHAKIEEFSEGHIEFAFKAIDLPKRPIHLRQALIDIKNKQGWLEVAEAEGKWRLSRVGELFVEDKLPAT